MNYHLEFKHYDNYRGGGCRVYSNGQLAKGCTASGCGYDREGAALGNWIQNNFQSELQERFKIEIEVSKEGHYEPIKQFYGAHVAKTKAGDKYISLDGACGKNCMVRILEAIGGTYEYLPSRSKLSNFALIRL